MLGAICGTSTCWADRYRTSGLFSCWAINIALTTTGMLQDFKGTGSKDSLSKTLSYLSIDLQSHIDYAMNAPLPGQERNSGPLYRLPWSVVFNTRWLLRCWVLSRGFVDAWISQTRDRKLSLGGRAADDALMQRRLAEAIWLIDVTITRLRTEIAELWQMAQDRRAGPMQLRAQVRWNMNRGCELVAQAITICSGVNWTRGVSFTRYTALSRHPAAMAHAYCLRIRLQRRSADICWVHRSPNLSSNSVDERAEFSASTTLLWLVAERGSGASATKPRPPAPSPSAMTDQQLAISVHNPFEDFVKSSD